MPEALKVEIQETAGSKAEETQKPPVKEEPKYVKLEDLDKINQAINNTREYNNRQLAEIKETLAKLTPKSPEPKPDDLDQLVQTDWKAGVKAVAREVLIEDQKQKNVQTEEQKSAQILEASKQKVMDKHKELSDSENPKTKEFLKVLDENPDFKTNPRGPLLAMYEMENRLNLHGNVEIGDTKVSTPAKEARSRATSIPAGTSPGSKGTYSLTKQDMDFCRLNGINPENYKRFKGAKEAQG